MSYIFKIALRKCKRVAELRYTLLPIDLLNNPRGKVREMELKLYEECERAGYSQPAEVLCEMQNRLDGGVDVYMVAKLGRKSKRCALPTDA